MEGLEFGVLARRPVGAETSAGLGGNDGHVLGLDSCLAKHRASSWHLITGIWRLDDQSDGGASLEL